MTCRGTGSALDDLTKHKTSTSMCALFVPPLNFFWGEKKKSRQKKERIWWVKNSLSCFTSNNILAYICTSLSWCHWMDNTRQIRSSHALPQHTPKAPTRRGFFLGFQHWYFEKQEAYFRRPSLWTKLFHKFYEHVWNTYIKKSCRFNFWD